MAYRPKFPQTPETYDSVYESGGWMGTYLKPYQESVYFQMFNTAIHHLGRLRARSVLEVGCGNGAFAQMVYDQTNTKYRGFDFSPVAVDMASERCSQFDIYTADAMDGSSYRGDYDTIVCLEVLEHLPDDMEVISNWLPGTSFVCSVPNFNSKYHERFFSNEDAVLDRYEKVLNIRRMESVQHHGYPGRRPKGNRKWFVFSGIVKE